MFGALLSRPLSDQQRPVFFFLSFFYHNSRICSDYPALFFFPRFDLSTADTVFSISVLEAGIGYSNGKILRFSVSFSSFLSPFFYSISPMHFKIKTSGVFYLFPPFSGSVLSPKMDDAVLIFFFLPPSSVPPESIYPLRLSHSFNYVIIPIEDNRYSFFPLPRLHIFGCGTYYQTPVSPSSSSSPLPYERQLPRSDHFSSINTMSVWLSCSLPPLPSVYR